MNVKINVVGPQIVDIDKMEIGDIAVIVKWTFPKYVGVVIQRTSDGYFGLGTKFYWSGTLHSRNDFRVHILPPGTILEIT